MAGTTEYSQYVTDRVDASLYAQLSPVGPFVATVAVSILALLEPELNAPEAPLKMAGQLTDREHPVKQCGS